MSPDLDAYDLMSAGEFLALKYKAKRLNKKRRWALRRFLRDERIPRWQRYRAYINSDRWKGLRLQILAQRGSVCERCGKFGRVDLHHLTYARLGAELPEDLKLYCRKCHGLMHPEKVLLPG